MLTHKKIVLGITGGIAAYKSADLTRRLKEAGAIVQVVMTHDAKRFITPLTLQAVSGLPVRDDLFDETAEAAMGHIELAKWADVIVIAPATANFIARLSYGFADDLLTSVCLASKAPLLIAPAMNQAMWHATATQENIDRLKQRGIYFAGPESGSQACGDIGLGRMQEPSDILLKIKDIFCKDLLAGYKILVTAGPTHEAIDPIRYLTNASSGKMGYALAKAAHAAGASVTLVSGPVLLEPPANMQVVKVKSAQEMYDAVMQEVAYCDLFFAVAAVADYSPEVVSPQKIHKNHDTMTLSLNKTIDIVATVAQLKNRPFIVGFAAETEHLIENARRKREQKKMDMIVANQASVAIGADENEVTLISPHGEKSFPQLEKQQLAIQLIQAIADEFKRDRG